IKTLGVSYTDDAQTLVTRAADEFQANVTNTTAIGQHVLTLPPNTKDIKYAVTASDNTDLISADGALVALPSVATDVTLTVTVSSATDANIKQAVNTTVHLNPASTKPYLLKNYTLDRTGGLKATVDVAQNPKGNLNSGSAVVLFELMKGNTPVSIVAVTKNSLTDSEEASAYFNVPGANKDYTVKVLVLDSFNSYFTNAGTSLADSVVLK
ncbi:MAG: hypothetical protein ACXVP5_12225, partial [Tumebacillaceae bacterium]